MIIENTHLILGDPNFIDHNFSFYFLNSRPENNCLARINPPYKK